LSYPADNQTIKEQGRPYNAISL